MRRDRSAATTAWGCGSAALDDEAAAAEVATAAVSEAREAAEISEMLALDGAGATLANSEPLGAWGTRAASVTTQQQSKKNIVRQKGENQDTRSHLLVSRGSFQPPPTRERGGKERIFHKPGQINALHANQDNRRRRTDVPGFAVGGCRYSEGEDRRPSMPLRCGAFCEARKGEWDENRSERASTEASSLLLLL
jgi:hypothetical protein